MTNPTDHLPAIKKAMASDYEKEAMTNSQVRWMIGEIETLRKSNCELVFAIEQQVKTADEAHDKNRELIGEIERLREQMKLTQALSNAQLDLLETIAKREERRLNDHN